jgi:hypothetical protein
MVPLFFTAEIAEFLRRDRREQPAQGCGVSVLLRGIKRHGVDGARVERR